MKKLQQFGFALLMVLVVSAGLVYAQSGIIHTEQGALRMVVPTGGSLDIESGGEIDIELGADLTVTGRAVYVPTDTPPSTTEGAIYWDDSENAMKHYNGSSWTAITAGSGDNTLDNAYDQGGAGSGATITADGGAVTITNTDADAAFVLNLTPTPGSSAASGGLKVDSGANSTEDSIQINNSGTGSDIQGTSSTWGVTKAGVGTFTDVQSATGTFSGALTLTNVGFSNGGQVNNDTNNEIEFIENSEELAFAFTSNTVTLATDTLMDAFDFGVVDDVSGVGTLAFDQVASTITLAANGAGDDLTIRVTGAQDASLHLSSAGQSVDALTIVTTAGGIDITNGGAAGGEDIDIAGTLASVRVTSAESATDAIVLDASLGGVQILASGASAGEDILLTATGSSIGLTSTEASTAAAISIQASGGGIDVDAVDDLILTLVSNAGSDDFRLIQSGANDSSISLEAAGTGNDAIRLQASAGGLDLDGLDDVNIAVSSTAGGDDLNLVQTGGNDSGIILTAAGTGADAISLVASGGGITLNANSNITFATNIAKSSGVITTLNSDNQTEVQSIVFDIEEATMDVDDGTGIKVISIDLNFNSYIVRAFANVSQGCGDAGDTIELIINNTDDLVSPATTLDAAQDQSAAGLLMYTPAGSATVEIGQSTSTNRYIVVGYKDVGDDGSTSANLQGTLVVEYIRF